MKNVAYLFFLFEGLSFKGKNRKGCQVEYVHYNIFRQSKMSLVDLQTHSAGILKAWFKTNLSKYSFSRDDPFTKAAFPSAGNAFKNDLINNLSHVRIDTSMVSSFNFGSLCNARWTTNATLPSPVIDNLTASVHLKISPTYSILSVWISFSKCNLYDS